MFFRPEEAIGNEVRILRDPIPIILEELITGGGGAEEWSEVKKDAYFRDDGI